jgi:DNA-binding NarL/FixJ family response regulator
MSKSPPQDVSSNEYASTEESRVAIAALSDDDYIKLMVIAAFFCRDRYLRRDQLEPEDLLDEAISRTLEGNRRWRKNRVSILRHLDRCMESISGHAVAQEKARTEMSEAIFADEFDEKTQSPRSKQRADAEMRVLAIDQLEQIRSLFNESPIAFQVLQLKAEGHTESEITLKLGIGKKGYEAARKKIERTMAAYLAGQEKAT